MPVCERGAVRKQLTTGNGDLEQPPSAVATAGLLAALMMMRLILIANALCAGAVTGKRARVARMPLSEGVHRLREGVWLLEVGDVAACRKLDEFGARDMRGQNLSDAPEEGGAGEFSE